MDPITNPPKRFLGVDVESAVLTAILCLTLAIAVAALTASILTGAAATVALLAAVVVTTRLLPSHSVPTRHVEASKPQ